MSLELPAIRSALIRQEDTIIFALIERAQFKANAACYEAGRAPYTQQRKPAREDLRGRWLAVNRARA